MVLLTFVWKCFQDRNFHGVIVGLYEQSIESWVGLAVGPLNSKVSLVGVLLDPVFGETENITPPSTDDLTVFVLFLPVPKAFGIPIMNNT